MGEPVEKRKQSNDCTRKDAIATNRSKRECRRSGDKASTRPSKVSPARTSALDALKIIRERDAYAQDVIAHTIDTSRLSAEDKAFATRLVLGVVSMRGTLDDMLNRCLKSPEDIQEDIVRDALALSIYELIYLQKSPHAAVDQGVNLVRSVSPRAAGLANAVLRKAVAVREAFPFGNPKTDVEAYARLHGFPVWLTQKLIATLGAQGAHNFMVASNEPAPLFVAVNAVRASDDEVLSILEAVSATGGRGHCCTEMSKNDPKTHTEQGATVSPSPCCTGCYRVTNTCALQDARIQKLIADGKLFVSDAAAQAVASLVMRAALDCVINDAVDGIDCAPADVSVDSCENLPSFLEVGAGRATKTLLLQSNAYRLCGRQLEHYVTVDNHAFKTDILEKRVQQYGIHVEQALTADATQLDDLLYKQMFDIVFIDAPCTGLGTLRRHVDIRWRLKPEMIAQSAETGSALLAGAAPHVASGGLLAYATCTITPEENQQVIEAFLASDIGRDFACEPIGGQSYFQTFVAPGLPDAHFLALLRRK